MTLSRYRVRRLRNTNEIEWPDSLSTDLDRGQIGSENAFRTVM